MYSRYAIVKTIEFTLDLLNRDNFHFSNNLLDLNNYDWSNNRRLRILKYSIFAFAFAFVLRFTLNKLDEPRYFAKIIKTYIKISINDRLDL